MNGFIILLLVLFLAGCSQSDVDPQSGEEINNSQVISNFDECVAVGNPVMESYPRQCRHGDATFVEDISGRIFECTPEQRNVDACIEIYQPVCAEVNVQCITSPCYPVKETFSNSCDACRNELVDNYVMGEC